MTIKSSLLGRVGNPTVLTGDPPAPSVISTDTDDPNTTAPTRDVRLPGKSQVLSGDLVLVAHGGSVTATIWVYDDDLSYWYAIAVGQIATGAVPKVVPGAAIPGARVFTQITSVTDATMFGFTYF